MKMKKYILALGLVSMLIGCNDDFMERYPLDNVTDENFWKTESDLKLYLNKLYPAYIKGHGDGWSQDKYITPLPVTGSPLAYGDFYSDNCVRTGSEPKELAGLNKIPTGAGSGGWSWTNLRTINFFLQRYQRSELPAYKLEQYAGEAYFFKALDYYKKVLFFGDVPWLTRDLNVDSEELYAPRNSRAEVMDSLLMCINKSVAGLPQKGKEESGRLNKDMANFLKARICLFEGTYRKYHKELNLDGTKFLQECVTACKELLGKYSLYTDNSGESYWKMFTAYDFSNNKEVILGRTYIENEFGHAFQRYYDQNNSNRQSMGATRGFIDEYLCIDGRPIYVGGSEGNYEENPNFEGYGMWRELENRDPRLTQTICRPGEHVTIYEGGIVSLDENGINYPKINYNTNGSTVTGYRVIKHWMGDMEEQDRTTNGIQAAIEFRYGELLLMYAEAKYELEGTLSQADVDMTINALRERAGFDFVKYPTSKLVVGQEPADPRLDKIYAEKLDYPVSPLLREIRRERRVEFAFEGINFYDSRRWLTAEETEKGDIHGMNIQAKGTPGKEEYPEDFFQRTVIEKRVFTPSFYLFPIPQSAINKNQDLVQNYKW